MTKKAFVIIIFLLAISFTVKGQASTEALLLTGKIKTSNKSNHEVANCIANSAMVMGVTAYTESEEDAIESSFVEGNYSYSYFVDDYESQAGLISFNYSYQIKDGEINYRFYDFNHDGNDTDFKSIGIIPKLWNKEVGEIFTEKQYIEILTDLTVNTVNAIRMVTKYCAK
jgi:hypothetical protein